MLGMRFGRLVVQKRTDEKVGRKYLYECLCDCGSLVKTFPYRLKDGRVKSCGCIRASAGAARNTAKEVTYASWSYMKTRCLNPQADKYEDYGGRGIKVCDRWILFEKFFEDMGDCPPNMTLDRIDCNGNYEPGNCRWATQHQQNRNKRNNVWVTHGGVTLIVADWAEKLGVNKRYLYKLIHKGVSIGDIILKQGDSK